ncbi:biotin--[acetyl-CoA-carboxylase] ligase [Nesterenkonia muleiensis]|uniref:biotin--[acetyl-CoA-carboxylase] ligase n=1 Tax=Nesterenkonia muleiensis TaxID=2282648 RepID=UPI000E746572|nr:biotin--[acetyl-CoA-carboxylase] ligase [Nesterenkonia muleiensis]
MVEARRPELDEDLLHQRLVASGLYSRLSRLRATGSTNADLLAAAEEPDFDIKWPHLSVLTAEEQTGGRGRLARAWSSPRGSSLSTSVVLRPSLPIEQRHWLSLAAGLALVEVLEERGVEAALKWPNDVQVAGRKIAGILAAVPPRSPGTVIVGCGINVLLTADQLPTPTSTSLLVEIGRAGCDIAATGAAEGARLRTELLADWLERFAGLVGRIQGAGDIGPVRDDIISAISTVGQQVRVELPDGTAVRGAAVAVENSGALTVEVSGWRRTFAVGDVFHLR